MIGATRSVIGIGYWADVTCDNNPAGIAKTVLSAVQLIGADHVSPESDFGGSIATTFDTSEPAALTQTLLDVGLSDSHIHKIMGENMLRVVRA